MNLELGLLLETKKTKSKIYYNPIGIEYISGDTLKVAIPNETAEYRKEDMVYQVLTGSNSGTVIPDRQNEFHNGYCIEVYDIEDILNELGIDDMTNLLEVYKGEMDEIGYFYCTPKNPQELKIVTNANEIKRLDKMFGKEKIAQQDLKLGELFNGVKKSVIGQDSQIESILTSIYYNQALNQSKLSKEDIRALKSNILVVGPTGTGKTEIVRQIANLINVPMTVEDSTRYTIAGYVGENVDDMLLNLLNKAKGNKKAAENGILVIDEIDKKSTGSGETERIASSGVQQSLLKIIEGGEVVLTDHSNMFDENKIVFDTSKLTVILMGAFSGLKEEQRKIGYGQEEVKKDDYSNVTVNDLIRFGMIPELIGRSPNITIMNALSLEDYKNIIVNSDISVVNLFQKYLKTLGVQLNMTDEFVDTLAQKAYRLGVGARGIKLAFESVQEKIIYQVFEEDIKKIVLDNSYFKDDNLNKYLIKK